MGNTNGFRVLSKPPPQNPYPLFQFSSNVSRQKSHISPSLSGGGKCPLFPISLSATNSTEFRSPRTLNSVVIYFRRTREGRGHLTSLKILGDGLLDYAIQALGMNELRRWREVERGDVIDVDARSGIFDQQRR